MADPSRVRISGVLQPFAVGFAAELARQGYTPRSLQTQLYLMAHVSRWLHAKDLDIADLPAQTQPFPQARQEAGYKQHLTGKALRPLLTYLRDQGAVPVAPTPIPAGPLDEALTRYRHYLTVERGLGEATARGYVDAPPVSAPLCLGRRRRTGRRSTQRGGRDRVHGDALRRAIPSGRAMDRDRAALAVGLSPCHRRDHTFTGPGCSVGSWPTIGRAAAAPRGRPRRAPARRLRFAGPLEDSATLRSSPRWSVSACAPPKWRPCASTTCSGVLERSSCTARDTGPSACPCRQTWARRSRRTFAGARPACRVAPSSSACSLPWHRSVPPA